MKPENEFQQIGKKLPYTEPEGFFDRISGETLLLAKKRVHKIRIRRSIWLSVGVAASLMAFILLVFNAAGPAVLPVTNPITQEIQSIEAPTNTEQLAMVKQLATSKTKKNDTVLNSSGNSVVVVKTEFISAVLADLSDEELSQMEAMYKTDPFLRESVE